MSFTAKLFKHIFGPRGEDLIPESAFDRLTDTDMQFLYEEVYPISKILQEKWDLTMYFPTFFLLDAFIPVTHDWDTEKMERWLDVWTKIDPNIDPENFESSFLDAADETFTNAQAGNHVDSYVRYLRIAQNKRWVVVFRDEYFQRQMFETENEPRFIPDYLEAPEYELLSTKN